MSWLGSFGVAVLASLAGGGAALLVALGWSSWFRWSTFEGASGYAIVAWVLGGLLLGLVLGLVVSRLVDAGAAHAFARAVGIAVGILGVSAGALAAGGRVLADVPPEIDGEQLMLMVEVRWPATQRERPSRSDASALRLGAVGGGVERRSERGPLWTEDMRQIDGRWVATGAVALFTERRDRALSVALGDVPADTASHAFLVPLPRRPGRAELQWSPWLPRMREGATALPGGLTYRFRVQRRSEPVRTQRFGDFEVSTVASGFSEPDDGTGRPSATSTFVVRHRGRPLVVDGASPLADDAVRAVTVVAAPRPALRCSFGATTPGTARC